MSSTCSRPTLSRINVSAACQRPARRRSGPAAPSMRLDAAEAGRVDDQPAGLADGLGVFARSRRSRTRPSCRYRGSGRARREGAPRGALRARGPSPGARSKRAGSVRRPRSARYASSTPGRRAGRLRGARGAGRGRPGRTRRRAEQQVGVAADQLRAGVHDEVGAERERRLPDRRRERVVDDDHGAGRASRADHGRQVDDIEHRVRGRLDPDESGAGDRRGDPGRASARRASRARAGRARRARAAAGDAEVRRALGDDPRAVRQLVEDRAARGEAGGERARRGRPRARRSPPRMPAQPGLPSRP